jgi:hypothetical protein
MPGKWDQTGLFDRFCRSLHVGSVEDRVLGFRVPQQNAIIRSDLGSSRECRLAAPREFILTIHA